MATQSTPSGRQPQEYDQMSRYEYRALPSTSNIRLLTNLHIDETADWSVVFEGEERPIPKLVGSLELVDLRDQPRYECLSYTWGPPDRVHRSKEQYHYTTKWYAQEFPIAIDGAVLWVGANLFTFLQHAVADLSELDEVVALLAHVKLETAFRAMEEISASDSTERTEVSGLIPGQSAQTVRAADSHDHDHRQRDDLEAAFHQHMKIGNTLDTSHTKSTDANGTTQSSTEHKGKSVLSDLRTAKNLQTRCEILWRTLLADTIKNYRPAPTEYGEAFAYTLYKRLDLLSSLVKHERLTTSHSRQHPTDEEQETASAKFLRNVEAVEALEEMERHDCDATQSKPGQLVSAAPVLTTVLSDLSEHLHNPREAKGMSMPPITPEFWKRMNQVEKERSLFVTENRGYLGCGPSALEPGDEIWMLEGATVPFVLRPILHGDLIQRFELSGQMVELFELPPKDGYELVGEAYVHGIMHGEAVADGAAEFVPLFIH